MQPSTVRQFWHGDRRAPSTPWGPAQYIKTFGRGVAELGCAQHGGLRVSRGLARKRFHPKVLSCAIERKDYFWFEEDCAYMLVVMTMPEMFDPNLLEQAKQSVQNWYPDQYTLLTGEAVALEESRVLRRRQFEQQTQDKFVAQCARGDWAEDVPAGMVKVSCRRACDGALADFLVPSEVYTQREEFGFVIDEGDCKIDRV